MIDDAQLARHLLLQSTATQEQLQRGLQLRNITGQSLYNILIENALCREEDIVDAAAHLLSQPCVHLHNFRFNDEVTSLISSSMATRNGVLPLALETQDDQTDRLILAMIDPLDIMAMDEIASHTGMDIHPVLAGPKDLRAAIERAYDQASAELDDLDDPFASLGPLPQLDSPAQEDSWADFFDQAQENPVQEESADISREMRNRPSSGPFDALPQDARKPSRDDSEPILDLGDWELSQADADEPKPDIDYAALGKDLQEAKKPTDPFGMFFVDDEHDAEKFSGTFIASPSRSFGGISDISSVAKDDDALINASADAPERTAQIEDEDIDDILMLSDEELIDSPPIPSAPSKKLTNALLEDSEVQDDLDNPPLQTQIASMKFSLSGLASVSPKKSAKSREDKLSKLSQKLQTTPHEPTPDLEPAPRDDQQLGNLNSSFAESFAQELADNLDQAMEPAAASHTRPQMLTPPGTLGRLQIKKIPAHSSPLAAPIVERNSHLELQEKIAPEVPAPEIIEGELAFESSEYDLIEPNAAQEHPVESDILAAFMSPSEASQDNTPTLNAPSNPEEIEQLAAMILDASDMGSAARPQTAIQSEHARHEQATAVNPALTVEYVRRMAATTTQPQPAQTTRPGPPQSKDSLPEHLTDHQLLHGLITLLVRQGIFSLDEIVTAAETSPENPSVSMAKLLEISKRFDQ